MDSALIPDGVKRCSFGKFAIGIIIVGGVLLWGVYAMLFVWLKGLNQTNMNDYYGFALWIWADLGVIALGGGAFFTGLLRYIIGKDELKNIINYAVLIGFICYSSALLILAIDIGQPLRGWFIFWHANVHSMLTVMAIFAATGVFLSFFHQGSLGGVAGVLYGRPFAFREGIFIWPWTFFLFTWSAAAYGPCFTLFVTRLTEKITGKKLVKQNVINLLAKISGWTMGTYIIAKIIDTWYWVIVIIFVLGLNLIDFYSNNPFYGIWILVAEIVVCGVIPAAILLTPKGRSNSTLLFTAVSLACIGVLINRWVMVLQVMAAPVMTFENWVMYIPSWQEVATTILPVAYGVILVMISFRYLPIFPQERELNP
jgi:menaquinone reductase, integral membrane subunit